MDKHLKKIFVLLTEDVDIRVAETHGVVCVRVCIDYRVLSTLDNVPMDYYLLLQK